MAGLLAAGFAAGLGAPAVSQAVDPAVIDAQVQAVMDAAAIPGAAYAIVEGGAVVRVAAQGTTGVGAVPMAGSTPIVIGSVGKSLTALAIRQLIEAGSVSLDAPVTTYLPWFRVASPADGAGSMTIRSLLTHRSGLSTATGQDPRWYEPGLTGEAVVRGLASASLDRAAGTYEYSNVNYVILGVVAEAVSGLSYAAYLDQHVFGPLGMTASTAAPASPPSGHRYLFGIPAAFAEPYPSGMVAAGYQVSTAADMARYVAALSNGGLLDGVDITGRRAADPVPRYGTDWLPVSGETANSILAQSGSTLSSNAAIVTLPSAKLGVVVVMNANPTEVMELTPGAVDLAIDVLRIQRGQAAGTAGLSVRQLYLVLDGLLLVLAAALVVHALRSRTWLARLSARPGRRFLVARTLVEDAALPLAVLVALPLWIGSAGSTPPGDVLAGWRFLLWTLPDLAVALLVLSALPLLLGAAKLVAWRSGRWGTVAH